MNTTLLQSLFFFLIIFLLLHLDPSEAEDIAVYMGERNLTETCETGKYSYVNIAGLFLLDNGQTFHLNLGDHCNPSTDWCTEIGREIENCQKQGIKMMLSIGRVTSNQSANLIGGAKNVSQYLWDNFLGGSSSSRPFGDLILDGIDLAYVEDNPSFVGDVARYLASYSSQSQTRKVYLSAVTNCPFPDNSELHYAVLDAGLFDFVWVAFYNNPSCECTQTNFKNFLQAWNNWATSLKRGKIFLGLVPAQGIGSGYVPGDILMSEVLPAIKKSPNYGGVMLCSRDYDKISGYSTYIQNFQLQNKTTKPLCTQQSLPACRSRNDSFVELFGSMSTDGINVDAGDNGTRCCEIICRNNCSCDAYAPINHINNTGCQIWLKGTRFLTASGNQSLSIYSSLLAVPVFQEDHKVNRWWIWLIIGTGVAIAILVIFYLCRAWLRKYKAKVEINKMQENLLHEIGGNAMLAQAKIIKAKNKGKTGNEVEIFSFGTIIAATNNFSDANKLGEGGFGPVYKGTFGDQQEVAIKRLSNSTGQGVIEFTNEAKLMAKLQHTNLVRLLGFCIQNDERILVYEYMSNNSLDFYLSDSVRKTLIDWRKRFIIIEGIAQGLLYLHHYSRLKVIHRDLKTSNILLDHEMKPKISDFGMARIFASTVSKENTNRVVGTLGYMPPEYVIDHVVSIKIDVFSFGVMLLEILSGKKNRSSYRSDHPLNLTGYAWQLWNEGKALDLIDPIINESSSHNELLRCIHIGLLCVQGNAEDRPTMLQIVSFLLNDTIQLTQPKHPAFFINEGSGIPYATEHHSSNDVTISSLHGI